MQNAANGVFLAIVINKAHGVQHLDGPVNKNYIDCLQPAHETNYEQYVNSLGL